MYRPISWCCVYTAHFGRKSWFTRTVHFAYPSWRYLTNWAIYCHVNFSTQRESVRTQPTGLHDILLSGSHVQSESDETCTKDLSRGEGSETTDLWKYGVSINLCTWNYGLRNRIVMLTPVPARGAWAIRPGAVNSCENSCYL